MDQDLKEAIERVLACKLTGVSTEIHLAIINLSEKYEDIKTEQPSFYGS